jgi:hypothetical protein
MKTICLNPLAMSELLTPELGALRKCATQLEAALEVMDRDLVHFLRDEGFITNDAHNEVLTPQSMLTEAQRAGVLAKGIDNRVRQDSKSFRILLDRFKQSGVLFEPIRRTLTDEYDRCTVRGAAVPQEISSSSSTPSYNHHLVEDTGELEQHGN